MKRLIPKLIPSTNEEVEFRGHPYIVTAVTEKLIYLRPKRDHRSFPVAKDSVNIVEIEEQGEFEIKQKPENESE